jgi:hypothetical protein
MKWIKCSEMMPKMYERVLIFVNYKDPIFKMITEAHLSDERFESGKKEWCSFEDWFDLDDITHWMTFPNPPTDD